MKLPVRPGPAPLRARIPKVRPRPPRPVADEIVRVLVEAGVDHLFGVPGGPLMPFSMAVARAGTIRWVLGAHELGAAFMAEGFFRASQRQAACAFTAGPGAVNALPGAALARREQTPMVLITAQVPGALYGRGAAQEFDTVAAFAPVCKRSERLTHPDRASELTAELVRCATARPWGPVHLSVDAGSWLSPSARVHPFHALPEHRRSAGEGLAAAVELLHAARRPAILAGCGVVHARAAESLRELVRALPRCRVLCSPRAKGVFPEAHEQSLGVFGFAGTERAATFVGESDALFVIGSRLGEITTGGWSPALLGKPMIQLDIDACEIGRIHPVDIALAGDARATLEELTQALIRLSARGEVA